MENIQHPIVEIYDVIEAQLAGVDSNHNTWLFNSLSQLSKNVDNSDLIHFKEEINGVNQILDKAIDLVAPGHSSTLRLIVASWLLDAANTEYDSGERNGKIIQIVEYEDAMGSFQDLNPYLMRHYQHLISQWNIRETKLTNCTRN